MEVKVVEVGVRKSNQWLASRPAGQPTPKVNYTPPEWSAAPTHPFRLEVIKNGAVVESVDVSKKAFVLIGRQEEWREGLRLPRRTQYQNRWERALLELLEESPAAEELLAAA